MKRRGFSFSIKQHNTLTGISLVEVVVAMGIATVLMGISMTTMHTVLRAERETSKAAWLGASFHRFSRLIRSDIHAATSLDFQNGTPQSSPELTIQKAGNEVVKYRIEGHQIIRVVSRQDQRVHRDTFHLPEGSHAHFFQQARLNQAGISIDQPDALSILGQNAADERENERPYLHELSIISTIGHDYRLSELLKKQPEKETN
ncbi:PulJ/GspJ family protein [Gimesia fumaroli]|jgi:Tfp pilus assembly protein PilE|uniref:Prepilin-type N-terminal cleavage/methylation domain-containing protein n=1 Tax=Gimesia fumaroli TaxID=2527976 RepID=A0A518I4R6_9PLAN|nr:hypothetical protein [Gimesia fumaroli]QDV48090.1 hypothetical protein Enr17x_00990 [Gimesia fumaroli]